MMRNLLLILLLPLFIFSCSKGGDVKVTINVSNPKVKELSIYLQDQDHELTLDKAGRVVKTLHLSKSAYAYIYTYNKHFTVYLQPNKDIDISFDDLDRYQRVFLYCNDGGINSYLASEDKVVRAKLVSPQKYNEKDYLKRINEIISNKREYLKSKNLPKDFVELEKERIAYSAISDIFYYPVYRRFFYKNKAKKTINAYDSFIDSMFVEKPELLQLRSYTAFIVRYVEKKCNERLSYKINKHSRHGSDRKDVLLPRINFAIDSVKNQEISEYLLNTFAYMGLSANGLDDSKEIIEKFRNNVKNEKYIEKFEALVSRFERMRKGEKAPEFSLNDINDKAVSLNNYKGQYVLLSIWSTWNYASKREMYLLNKLVDEYSGHNIKFLNVCIDDRKDVWKRYVNRKHYNGIHVYAGDNLQFHEDYIIKGLPRFILIDREGRIISSQAPFPNTGKLKPVIDSLKGL